MDIDDIPIPESAPINVESKKNEPALGSNNIETSNISLDSHPSEAQPEPMETNSVKTKPKSVTKLPMPPGMEDTELEAIESPPSSISSPVSSPKREKSPPHNTRKSIKDLPMPPGKKCYYTILLLLYKLKLFFFMVKISAK